MRPNPPREDERERRYAIGAFTLTATGTDEWTLTRDGRLLAEGTQDAIKDVLNELRQQQATRPEEPRMPDAPQPEHREPPEPDGPHLSYLKRLVQEDDRRIKIGVWEGQTAPRKDQLCSWHSGLEYDPTTKTTRETAARVRPLRHDSRGQGMDSQRPYYVAVRPSLKSPYQEVLGASRNLELVTRRVGEAEKTHRNECRQTLADLIALAERTRPEKTELIEGLREQLRLQGSFEPVRTPDGPLPQPELESAPVPNRAITDPLAPAARAPEPEPAGERERTRSTLRQIADSYREAPAEPAPEPRPAPAVSPAEAKRFYPVVSFVKRFHNTDVVQFRVAACPDSLEKANATIAHRGTKTLGVWSHPFQEPLTEGQQLVAKYDDQPDLQPIINRGTWREETQGEYARVAVWSLGQREGQVNDLVKVVPTTGETEQGIPHDDRVLPIAYDPERERHAYQRPETPTYALLTPDPKVPGAWRIAALSPDRDAMVARKAPIESRGQLQRSLQDPKQWQTMNMTM